jgi:catechol 2,3-dioxygenase-like lactoylglutathione lyase family enzyme
MADREFGANRLHHIGMTVSDLQASIRFYAAVTAGEVLGPFEKSGPAVDAATGYPGVVVRQAFVRPPGGDTLIELLQYQGGSGHAIDPDNGHVGAAHPAIEVADLDFALEAATANGGVPLSEPKVATEGPMEGCRYLYVIGPDRVRVELVEPPA